MYSVTDADLENVLKANGLEKTDLIIAHGPGNYDDDTFTKVVNNPNNVEVFLEMNDEEECIVVVDGTMELIGR